MPRRESTSEGVTGSYSVEALKLLLLDWFGELLRRTKPTPAWENYGDEDRRTTCSCRKSSVATQVGRPNARLCPPGIE